MKVTAKGYIGTYDKGSHSIKVTAPKGAKVEYRLSKNDSWSTKNPKFKDPSEKAITVYYRVTMANYKAVEGSAKVHIKFNLKKGATFTSGKYKYKITGASTVTFTGITDSGMKTVTIPKTVKYGGKTFKVTAVATKALKGNKKVTKVTIGSNVTSIGSSAFAGCIKLTTVTIGSKVKTIGVSAFEGCKKLSKVTSGGEVTTIDDKAFKNCTALKSITVPGKVTKIDTQAFYGCKNLKTITINSTKLKSVGKNAWKGIYSKATIKVPSSKLKYYTTLLKNKGQGSKVKIVKK
jgi:hypothetical protein